LLASFAFCPLRLAKIGPCARASRSACLRHHKRESQRDVSGCSVPRSRLHSRRLWYRHTTADRMAAIGNQINAAVGNWSAGRTTWIADAHGYGKRFIVRADEKLTAFLELLHVLLSAQIKIGHATVWMRIRVCVSFILRPSLLPFGFAPCLRASYARHSLDC
jgi:hypothetical protein